MEEYIELAGQRIKAFWYPKDLDEFAIRPDIVRATVVELKKDHTFCLDHLTPAEMGKLPTVGSLEDLNNIDPDKLDL